MNASGGGLGSRGGCGRRSWRPPESVAQGRSRAATDSEARHVVGGCSPVRSGSSHVKRGRLFLNRNVRKNIPSRRLLTMMRSYRPISVPHSRSLQPSVVRKRSLPGHLATDRSSMYSFVPSPVDGTDPDYGDYYTPSHSTGRIVWGDPAVRVPVVVASNAKRVRHAVEPVVTDTGTQVVDVSSGSGYFPTNERNAQRIWGGELVSWFRRRRF